MRKRLASDLSRNPRAPASSTSLTRVSVSCIVKIRISTPGTLARICLVASTPLSAGRLKSRTATSGRVARALSIASIPSEASAATSQPGCDSRIVRNPARTTSWSSAIRIRIIEPLEAQQMVPSSDLEARDRAGGLPAPARARAPPLGPETSPKLFADDGREKHRQRRAAVARRLYKRVVRELRPAGPPANGFRSRFKAGFVHAGAILEPAILLH